jgi:hypothetical protein
MTTYIYILKLENHNYYIGKTNSLEKRFNEHYEGKGGEYTKKYKMKSIKKIIENVDPKDLDKYVIKYMNKYGVDHVRGGSFSSINLSSEQISVLNKFGVKSIKQQNIETCSIRDKKCNQTQTQNQTQTLKESKREVIKKVVIRNANGTCYRCGRDGHYIEQCNEQSEREERREEESGLEMFYKSKLI